eukprot:CAMPEP_0114984676 /NCGR_PEP_ID=MMETSP0216-20121206/7412_1 /TAXON_ID=223996 /ORGANISM="Protocruzia adherens, Strain Boccale" /LENGTH=154 /DNA_ID=CAMNT_0002346845 /DNA_START=161 /DNA_END=625 /DNA_ORIENTATION=-
MTQALKLAQLSFSAGLIDEVLMELSTEGSVEEVSISSDHVTEDEVESPQVTPVVITESPRLRKKPSGSHSKSRASSSKSSTTSCSASESEAGDSSFNKVKIFKKHPCYHDTIFGKDGDKGWNPACKNRKVRKEFKNIIICDNCEGEFHYYCIGR